jgi:hypothetical protein
MMETYLIVSILFGAVGLFKTPIALPFVALLLMLAYDAWKSEKMTP